MKFNRRLFIKSGLGAGVLATTQGCVSAGPRKTTITQLDKAAAAPVLKIPSVKSPVKIASIELLRGRRNYFVRTRSTDGAVGVTNGRAAYLYPILQQLVIPFFLGKDVRDLESLIDGVYVYRSNYKLSGESSGPVFLRFGGLDTLATVYQK